MLKQGAIYFDFYLSMLLPSSNHLIHFISNVNELQNVKSTSPSITPTHTIAEILKMSVVKLKGSWTLLNKCIVNM